jgi:hypothetical protein
VFKGIRDLIMLRFGGFDEVEGEGMGLFKCRSVSTGWDGKLSGRMSY